MNSPTKNDLRNEVKMLREQNDLLQRTLTAPAAPKVLSSSSAERLELIWSESFGQQDDTGVTLVRYDDLAFLFWLIDGRFPTQREAHVPDSGANEPTRRIETGQTSPVMPDEVKVAASREGKPPAGSLGLLIRNAVETMGDGEFTLPQVVAKIRTEYPAAERKQFHKFFYDLVSKGVLYVVRQGRQGSTTQPTIYRRVAALTPGNGQRHDHAQTEEAR